MKTAAIGGTYDLRLSYLVGTLCKNSDVRTFAASIAADRIGASVGLKGAAKDAGIDLPTKLDDVHQKRYEGFKDYKGDNLERDFVKAMVQRHADGVALFTQASKEAKNPAVKEFATTTLATLQKRLEEAKKLDK